MPKLGITTLTGKSGKNYTMNVYPGNMQFNDFIPGVYLIARNDGGEANAAIYLGESDNVDVTLRKHDKQACFDQHSYNRIAFFRNASKEVRDAVIADLLPALKPPCND
jgi:hypothetical protein